MRIDGFPASSYPVKRTPARRAPVADEQIDDAQLAEEVDLVELAKGNRRGGLPVRQQDVIFPRARDRRTACALASYLATAGYSEWDMDILGLDLYI
ncbi:hypothetical protein [Pseudomonas cremoricolorata]|uniref:Uncharacterized protein n=1 Tax=Pseudomonas cremoricolorata TaxID=157783 RepID=A0A089WN26_9PSED|nr:hypothetical protein [Pseudomonas cremoricolorata]AIR87882.1 hypothetical protein LK03_00910 [Pseudomonas cremoricolorata]